MTNAEAYDRGFAHLSSHTVGPLLASACRGRAPHLLDVGCGTGVVTAAALALGAEVTAVDADPAMLELAARRHPYATIRLAALPELPFEDAQFDAIAGNFIINHVPDATEALRELHRVLRPGGALALTWWKSGEMTATDVFAEAIAAAEVPYDPRHAPSRPTRPRSASPGCWAGRGSARPPWRRSGGATRSISRPGGPTSYRRAGPGSR
ncbi:class I SAM-dependent methyltransferase [Nonomuraea antimicrobica]